MGQTFLPYDSYTHGTSIHTLSLLGHSSLSDVTPIGLCTSFGYLGVYFSKRLFRPRPLNIGTAIIFGMATRDSLLPEAARAFLRHAYNQFYHDFANVDIKDAAFHWPLTFRDALHSFRCFPYSV